MSFDLSIGVNGKPPIKTVPSIISMSETELTNKTVLLGTGRVYLTRFNLPNTSRFTTDNLTFIKLNPISDKSPGL